MNMPNPLLALIISAVLVGCDGDSDQKDPKPQPKAEQQDPAARNTAKYIAEWRDRAPGRYVAKVGDPARGLGSEMTLELRGDGTATLVNVMAGRMTGSTQPTRKQAEGAWEMKWQQIDVTLDRAADGRPIPESERRIQLMPETNAATGRIDRLDDMKSPSNRTVRFVRVD